MKEKEITERITSYREMYMPSGGLGPPAWYINDSVLQDEARKIYAFWENL